LLAAYGLKASDERLLIQLVSSVKRETEDLEKHRKLLADQMATDRATVVRNAVELVDTMYTGWPAEYRVRMEDIKKDVASRTGRDFDETTAALQDSVKNQEANVSSLQTQIGDIKQEIAGLDIEIEKTKAELTSARRARLAAAAQLEPCAKQVLRDARLRLALELVGIY
jgi:septation ring formation regulator EzrA